MKKFRVGLIGTGVISDIYLKTCRKFDILDVVACGSLDVEESTRKAEKYHIPRVCSPDEIIDEGVIGEPAGVSAFAATHGVERHHPNPIFYYKPGGGPILDLGPYYLTAMISLLGPVKRSCGFSKRTFDERMIESQPRYGEIMKVEVDTHVCGMLEFADGVIGSLMTSFDIWDSQLH